MRSVCKIIFLAFCVNTIICLPPFPSPNDLAKSLFDVTSGVVKKLPDTLPSVDAIFSTSKNLVAGYPIEAVIYAINHFCKLSGNSIELL